MSSCSLMMESEATTMIPEATAPLLYVLMIFWGVIDCFFGFRVFKITIAIILAFVGSLVGAWLGYLIGSASWIPILAGFLIGGLGGALFAGIFFRTTAAVLGAFWAFTLVSPYLYDLAEWWFWLIAAVVCILAGILAIYVATFLIIVITAFSGAFRIVYGIWFFLGGPALLAFLYSSEYKFEVFQEGFLPLFVALLLGAIGAALQLWSEHRRF